MNRVLAQHDYPPAIEALVAETVMLRKNPVQHPVQPRHPTAYIGTVKLKRQDGIVPGNLRAQRRSMGHVGGVPFIDKRSI